MNTAHLMEKLETHLYHIKIGGIDIVLSDSIIVMWLVMVFLVVFAFVLTRNLKTVPDTKQNFAETIVEFVNSFSKDNIGHHWKPFAPYFGTILLFLIVSNTVSIFNVIPTGEDLYKITGIHFFEKIPQFHISPPTKDINVTAAMAIMSIMLVLFSGLRFKSFKDWLKGFVQPSPIILPFKILDYFSRPLSLCFRLFGNILAAYTLMELIYMFIGLAIPAVLSLYFDLFDGILQAYIFVFLTSIYIAEEIE